MLAHAEIIVGAPYGHLSAAAPVVVHSPREIAGFDCIEKIAAVAFAVLGNQSCGFLIGEILDALLGAEMEFDPCSLIRRNDHREGVATRIGGVRSSMCHQPSAK